MKKEDKFTEKLKTIDYPVLILSSCAGGGNYAVGEAMRERLGGGVNVVHMPIEKIISKALYAKHFRRYRDICLYAPRLLYSIYYFPLNYIWGYLEELLFQRIDLEMLKNAITRSGARTVICTNHRACFWVSALKRRKAVTVSLWGFVTDYYINAGWRFIFWDRCEFVFGPIKTKWKFPGPLSDKYLQAALPLKNGFYAINDEKASNDRVLIIGGEWGLGPIAHTVRVLFETFPHISMHVVCGENKDLFGRLQARYAKIDTVHLYEKHGSLISLLENCSAVITKPGAIFLTEAFQAKKKIFLLEGLPVVEQKNARYAVQNFGATRFSIKNFKRWYMGLQEDALYLS